MDRPVDAYAHYRKALEANPIEPRALRAVRDVLSRQQEWAELGKVLEAAARSKRGEQDIPLLIELATLIWKRLNQPDMAESFFRRVRKLDAVEPRRWWSSIASTTRRRTSCRSC